jgi:hypothetical protein
MAARCAQAPRSVDPPRADEDLALVDCVDSLTRSELLDSKKDAPDTK